MSRFYHIIVQGHLEPHWAAWFDGLMITNRPNGYAVLAGPVVDQAALYGLLLKIRDLGLPLIAVQPVAMPAPGDQAEDDEEVQSP